MELFLGMDGGQTTTKAVIADRRGRVLGRGKGGPANHADEPGGKTRLESAIRDAAGAALRQAGLGEIRSVVFEAAYVSMTGGARNKESIVRRLLRTRRLTIEQDTRAAWAGALGCKPGIVVIAGTGSVAYGVSMRGEAAQVGGWGYVFGDEGSAFHMARRAVAEAVRWEEGWGRKTGLVDGLLGASHMSGMKELMARFYSGDLRRDELAGLSQVVLKCARRGDRIAREIMQETASHLALLAAAAVQALRLKKTDPLHISIVGGVSQSEEVWQDFRRSLHKLFKDAVVSRPLFSTDMGALFLAYRMYDEKLCAEILGQFRHGK